MAYCWFWFIHPATAMTMNRNGFKMFRISAAHYVLAEVHRAYALRPCCFNQIEILDTTGPGNLMEAARRPLTLTSDCGNALQGCPRPYSCTGDPTN
jgi:hypothetical protein